MYIMITRYIK